MPTVSAGCICLIPTPDTSGRYCTYCRRPIYGLSSLCPTKEEVKEWTIRYDEKFRDEMRGSE